MITEIRATKDRKANKRIGAKAMKVARVSKVIRIIEDIRATRDTRDTKSMKVIKATVITKNQIKNGTKKPNPASTMNTHQGQEALRPMMARNTFIMSTHQDREVPQPMMAGNTFTTPIMPMIRPGLNHRKMRRLNTNRK
jgi:hypothetical protein